MDKLEKLAKYLWEQEVKKANPIERFMFSATWEDVLPGGKRVWMDKAKPIIELLEDSLVKSTLPDIENKE